MNYLRPICNFMLSLSFKTITKVSEVIISVILLLTVLSCIAAETIDKTYDDPYTYCKAVDTVDTPGREYIGPSVPKFIAKALKKRLGSHQSVSLDTFISGTYWRCMDGKVYACNIGANLPCAVKADMSKKPTKKMMDYCKENAASNVMPNFIPAYITGHSTIYEWKCDGITPVAGKALAKVDKQGYQTDIWYMINPIE